MKISQENRKNIKIRREMLRGKNKGKILEILEYLYYINDLELN